MKHRLMIVEGGVVPLPGDLYADICCLVKLCRSMDENVLQKAVGDSEGITQFLADYRLFKQSIERFSELLT